MVIKANAHTHYCPAAVLGQMRARIIALLWSASKCARAFSSRSRRHINARAHYRPATVGAKMRENTILQLTLSPKIKQLK